MTLSTCARSAFLATTFVVTTMLASAPVQAAAYTVIGREDAVTGFVGPLFPGIPGYDVASDGEVSFQPFGINFDVSDAIRLDNGFGWYQATDSKWTQTDAFTWAIPASDPGPGCGPENVNTCEMVGHFISAFAWNPAFTGTYVIMDADGSIGDMITTYNVVNAAGLSEAHITFVSDPIPEPSEWALMAMGLAVLSLGMKRRQQKA